MKSFDTVVCGAGIVGLTLARELISRGRGTVALVEKESGPGLHASGRNSGVLHAGIYYSSDSLKAKFCSSGNRAMKDYCASRGLPLLESGKVIVAKSEDEVPVVRHLHERALANGAEASIIDEGELREIEPEARTSGIALYSPATAVVDPRAVVAALAEDLTRTGRASFMYNTRVLGQDAPGVVRTSSGPLSCGLFINAAGAYSDIVAHAAGLGLEYRILPFKGTYKKIIPSRAAMVRGNIYPVPNIRNPFLGVHFTRNTRGEVYVGPTAIPAFGRENYGIMAGLDREAASIFCRDAMLFMFNRQFRSLALEEPKKYFSPFFLRGARQLVRRLDYGDIADADKVGIRPQLVNYTSRELVMDFVVVREEKSVHILNAVSPAFTCSMPFAKHVVDAYL
jgi:L-2-hydroxyglutarate oxidase LhgO